MGVEMSNEGNEYFVYRLKNKLMIMIIFFKHISAKLNKG